MSNIDKRSYRADGGDISTGRLREIADNPYGDEEKCWLAKRVISLQAELEAEHEQRVMALMGLTMQHTRANDAEGRIAELETVKCKLSDSKLLSLAKDIVENLVDTGGTDQEYTKQYVDWTCNRLRAAVLQGAEPSRMSGIMPDYEGGVMTQREFFQAGWEAHHAAMLRAGSPVQFGWSKGHFGYHTLFNAICKAVNIQGGALSISVSAFEDAMLVTAPQQEV
ncbi:hypothetical protein ACFC2F_03470 [Enterobacter sichuanensis]|jgi:hypothetical protein|uniref:hypothetical protein n=1 Tax=Enterobacter TaxID=547 RepID=UPI0025851745|nr:hypothetical protein [Enterobacter sp.]MCI8903520.1 hypothetical protein [Enterobacter sp.]